MQETLLVAPTVEPITLSLAKQHLKVTHTLEDDLITSMISSAREACENTCNISIARQRWRVTFRMPEWSGDEFGLTDRILDPERILKRCAVPRPPLVSIETVYSQNRIGTQYPMVSGTDFILDPVSGYLLWPNQRRFLFGLEDGLPRPNLLVIEFTSGYTPETTPASIREAILVTMASFYENRGDDDTSFPKKALQLLKSSFATSRSAG